MSGKPDVYSDEGSAKDFLHLIVDGSPFSVKFFSMKRRTEFSPGDYLREENLGFADHPVTDMMCLLGI